MYFVDLIDTPIQVEKYIALVESPKAGAITTFLGVTRDNFEDKEVVELSYECYNDMALSEMKKICEQALTQKGILKVVLVHRLGVVPVKEASVVCIVSSEHRKEGYQVNEQMMYDLKKNVPIWKKEIYHNGNSQWKENSEQY